MNDWRDRARCRPGSGIDPELFFPTGSGGHRDDEQIAAAKAVCNRCDVRLPCLDWSLLAAHADAGVWGGKTEHERRSLRTVYRQRRRIA